MRTFPALLTVLLLLALASCSNRDTAPRPRGFARVEAYGDSLKTVDLGPVTLQVNAEAGIESPQPGWLNVSYGRLGATMYLTADVYAERDSLRSALRNRSERISLNLSGRRAQNEVSTNAAGMHIKLTRALEPAPIPLQFMAFDSVDTFVSGAVVMSGPVEPADSLAPTLAELSRQLDLLLNSLARP